MAMNGHAKWVESKFGSTLVDLVIHLDSPRVTARYDTPAAAGFLRGSTWGESGRSSLDGEICRRGDGSAVIWGRWIHEPGPLSMGSFEVAWDAGSATMRGWWSEKDGVEQEWVWSQTTTLEAALAEFTGSVHMARYTLLCCWCFLFFTLAQLALALRLLSPMAAPTLQTWFNLIYTTTYGSFLLAYGFMRKRPALAYMAGVFCYALGYATFLVLYARLAHGERDGGGICYVVGSANFLAGSAFLVLACIPDNTSALSPVRKSASLLWGSVAFFAGSVLFTMDAIRGVTSGGQYTPLLTQLGCAGLRPAAADDSYASW